MNTVSRNYDLGPAYIDGPEGPDRSLLAHVLDCIKHGDLDGWAIEFGVGTGTTLEMISSVLPVIGFDSFMGLPEDWRPGFGKGRFRADPPKGLINATLVAGWFDDTVPDYDWPDKISLVHFDADLFSSTITCLNAIGPYLEPGCFLVFDEFHGFTDDYDGEMPGEQRAFRDYAEAHDLTWDVIGHGREQWAVRLAP